MMVRTIDFDTRQTNRLVFTMDKADGAIQHATLIETGDGVASVYARGGGSVSADGRTV